MFQKIIYKMSAILSSLGCVKDYNPSSQIYFQLIDLQ